MTAESDLRVVPFPGTAADVTASLRRTADKIETGDYGAVRFAGLVLCVGTKDLAYFSFGNCTALEVAGAFARGSVVVGCVTDELEETEQDGA